MNAAGSESGAMRLTAERFDAVIVGARCAGSATAIALAQRGLRVLAIDSARFPSDTLSTHLLWPSTMAEIHALGALAAVEAAGAPRLPIAEAVLDDIGWRTGYSAVSGIDYAMCLRRAHLDDALVRTARAAGAEVREQCTATAVLFENGRATGIEYVDDEDRRHVVHAPVVVGADGRKSLVAQQVGVRAPRLAAPSGRACYFAYWKDDREDLRHIASQWRVDGLLGTAFPCDNGDLLCLLQPPVDLIDQFRGRKVTDAYLGGIGKLPGLARRLAGCELVSRVRACTGIESYFRTSSGPGWALPGDAGHFKDPVTAQGIRDGYRYGQLLGEYLASVRMRATSTPTPSTARPRDRPMVGATRAGLHRDVPVDQRARRRYRGVAARIRVVSARPRATRVRTGPQRHLQPGAVTHRDDAAVGHRRLAGPGTPARRHPHPRHRCRSACSGGATARRPSGTHNVREFVMHRKRDPGYI